MREADRRHAVEVDVDEAAGHFAELDRDVLCVTGELRGIECTCLPPLADRLLGLAADRDRLPAARMLGNGGIRDGGGPRGHAVHAGCAVVGSASASTIAS